MQSVKSLLSTWITAVVFVAGCAAVQAQTLDEAIKNAPRLISGTKAEAAINPGEFHFYVVELTQGAAININVAEKGANVNLYFNRAADKAKIGKAGYFHGYGRETMTLRVEEAGLYILFIGSAAGSPVGSYEVTAHIKETPAKADLERIRAEEILADVIIGTEIITHEDRRRVIEKLKLAIPIWKALGDKYWEGFTLSVIARLNEGLGNNREALKLHLEALSLMKAAGEIGGEAQVLKEIALLYYAELNSSEAEKYLLMELPLRRGLGDPVGESAVLTNLGVITDASGKKKEGIKYFEQALILLKKTGDHEQEVTTIGYIGLAHKEIGEKKKGLIYLEEGLALAREKNIRRAEGKSLNLAGMVYGEISETEKALKYLEESLAIAREIKQPEDEGAALNNLGRIYDGIGKKEKALEFLNLSLKLARATGDIGAEVAVLGNIGNVYASLGDPQEALKCYKEALQNSQKILNKFSEITLLVSIGTTYDTLGNKREAKEFLEKAIALAKTYGDRPNEAAAVNNLGSLYLSLGNYREALNCHLKALELQRSIGDKMGEAVSLTNAGGAYRLLGNLKEAQRYYELSVALAREIGNRNAEATALSNLGDVLTATGEHRMSLTKLNEALRIRREIGDKNGQGMTLNNISVAHIFMGDRAAAGVSLNEALPLARSAGDKSAEGRILTNLMTLQGQWYGDRKTGIFYGKQAVNLFQGIRSNISGLDKGVQNTFLQSIENTYRELAGHLIAEGRIAEAEQVLAMLKEEEYFGYLRRDPAVKDGLKAEVSLNNIEKEAAEEYARMAGEITRIGQEFGKLDAKKNAFLGSVLSPEDQAQYDLLSGQLKTATVVFNKFLDGLKQRFTSNDKRIANVESDLMGLLKRLDQPRTVIISTIAGEDRLNLIVTTSNTQTAHTVQIKEAVLNNLVADFRAALKDPAIDPRAGGKKLYDILFPAGLQKDLENIGADTIIWSLDGSLRYAPMAALSPDGSSYLVEKYTSATIALASRDKLGAPAADRTKWQVLGVGVSKGTDVKEVSGATRSFGPLAAVPDELCSIVDDPKKKAYCESFSRRRKTGVIGGLMLADDDFTLQNFTNFLGQAAVVHIASHFNLDPGNEANSYLLLGKGETLTMAEVQNTSLTKTDLLTLSACNTAMAGGSGKNGVEVEGFAALAQNKGARSVVATLWAVADPSTRDAMAEFYRQLRADQTVGKAEALRKAQLALMQGNYSTGETPVWRGIKTVGAPTFGPAFNTDKNAPYAHPYYWSPFILTGDWR